MKRIAIIAGSVLAVAGIGYALYRFSKKSAAPKQDKKNVISQIKKELGTKTDSVSRGKNYTNVIGPEGIAKIQNYISILRNAKEGNFENLSMPELNNMLGLIRKYKSTRTVADLIQTDPNDIREFASLTKKVASKN